jgi:hypothetical protein
MDTPILVSKKNILYVSQRTGFMDDATTSYCGIGIQGKLTSDILISGDSTKYTFLREFLDNNSSLEKAILKHSPAVIVYNYHPNTMGWVQDSVIRNKYRHIKHVMIVHCLEQTDIDNFNPNNFHGFNYIISDNSTLRGDNKHVFIVSRSLPRSPQNMNKDRVDIIPKIGFQGFGFSHKGIDRIAHQIQQEFDEAIFRLHIPFSLYGDKYGVEARKRIDEVKAILTKPGIKLEVSHKFLSNEEIIQWLNENTVNCYFNNYSTENGIASSPDYAIAARRPIAVNNSRMLRHLHNLTPPIEIEKTSLRQIIHNGLAPLKPIYDRYKQENVVRDYERICDILLG